MNNKYKELEKILGKEAINILQEAIAEQIQEVLKEKELERLKAENFTLKRQLKMNTEKLNPRYI